MVALNFKAQFVPLIVSGEKRQTIRSSKRCKVGTVLQLYTGMRTKNCRKLVDPDPICDLVDYVRIHPDYLTFGNRDLHPKTLDGFARADGFRNYQEMLEWFRETYGHPYIIGYVHRWRPSRAG